VRSVCRRQRPGRYWENVTKRGSVSSHARAAQRQPVQSRQVLFYDVELWHLDAVL
jgi:hypothetical protein